MASAWACCWGGVTLRPLALEAFEAAEDMLRGDAGVQLTRTTRGLSSSAGKKSAENVALDAGCGEASGVKWMGEAVGESGCWATNGTHVWRWRRQSAFKWSVEQYQVAWQRLHQL